MSLVQVEDCQTAADVLRLARASAERRRKWNARPVSTPGVVPFPVHAKPPDPCPLPIAETIKLTLEWHELGLVAASSPVLRNFFGIQRIVAKVARAYGLTVAEIISQRRDQTACQARHVAFLLAKILTGQSLPVIGRACGGRDHTTVLHAIRKLDWLRGQLLERLTEDDHLEVWIARACLLHPLPQWKKKYRPRIRSEGYQS